MDMIIPREQYFGSSVGYFSMEVGLAPEIPTYSGGLGVLAGDTLKAAADLSMPMVGVTLLHRHGYVRQHLDAHGFQSESTISWNPEDHLELMDPVVTVQVSGRPVQVRAWKYEIRGYNHKFVPVYFLDTDLPENDEQARRLTDHLYGGDDRYRLSQEAILGLGGIAMLTALGHTDIDVYHMNEGHAALLAIALLEQRMSDRSGSAILDADVEAVRGHCIFTTHTPVPAGHDQFPASMVRAVLGNERFEHLEAAGCCQGYFVNLTFVALRFSRYVNGVAMRHGEVARSMFPQYPIDSITNGVHATTWTSPSFQRLFDRHIPEWRHDNLYLRYAVNLPLNEIIDAHQESKEAFCREVKQRTGVGLDPSVLTLGFARRATTYKRADLLFADPDRLRRIARDVGRIQIVFGGKAHPRDEGGKELIRRVFAAGSNLRGDIDVIYLEDYDMALGMLFCSGVDIWLNTPQKPLEASGTSGMKAALNAVPSLSVIDGWWVEGHVEGITGWGIGDERPESVQEQEIAHLYDQLENKIVPMYYQRPLSFAEIGRWAIALNGSFFNAQRMVSQYATNAYRDVSQEPALMAVAD
jgi:glycogen phosphorylase